MAAASLTRIWPTDRLVQMFRKAAFGYLDIGYNDERETIILRDENKKAIEYEDRPRIKQMRQLMTQYNELLHAPL